MTLAIPFSETVPQRGMISLATPADSEGSPGLAGVDCSSFSRLSLSQAVSQRRDCGKGRAQAQCWTRQAPAGVMTLLRLHPPVTWPAQLGLSILHLTPGSGVDLRVAGPFFP
jgi:hypothetical protein